MKTTLKLTLSLLPLSLLGAALPQISAAQSVQPAPSVLNFQGRLATPSGNPVPDGTYSIRFSLWNVASGGTAANNEKWTQTISNVAVKNGVFAVVFDTTTNAVLFNTDLWLEIKVGNDAPLAPRQRLLSVAAALKANTVPDFSITSNKIQNGAITADKLAPGLGGATGVAGGDLTGSYPNPSLKTDPTLLTKVSGSLLNVLSATTSVDQVQALAPNIISDYAWQSFKPTAGRLTAIEIYVGTSTGATHIGDLVIRKGIGNDKPEVARVQVTVQPAIGWQKFDLANGGIDVTNTDYTWDFGSFAPLRIGYANGNPYPNGISDIGDTMDFAFRTYLRTGTNPSINALAPFNLSNTTQLVERLRLSGQEFYQANNTSTDGISFLMGYNRANNRQLWIGDSARLAPNATNPVIRLGVGATNGSFIDAMATDGVTPQNLILNVNGGNVAIGAAPNTSRLSVNGVIESKTGGIKFPDGTVQTTAPSTNYWQGSGNNIYTTNSGNVGIGDSTPEMSLEVARQSLYGAPASGVAYNANRWLYLHSGATDHSLIWNTGSSLRFGAETTKGTGYAEVARITSSGLMGIGTPTPTNKLQVNNTLHASSGYGLTVSNASFGANIQYNGASTGIGLAVDKSDAATGSALLTLRNNVAAGANTAFSVSDSGWLRVVPNNAASPVAVAEIGHSGGSAPTLRIHTQSGSADAIRIKNAGVSTEVGMFVDSTGRFRISNNILAQPPLMTILENNGTWSSTSDRRMKNDIQPLSGLLERTLALRPVSYFFNSQDRKANPLRQIGFIAQEVEPLFPSLVHGSGEDIKSLDYASLSVAAVGSIQELHGIIQKQAQEIDALKAQAAKVNALESRLAEMAAVLSQLKAQQK